MPPLTPHSATRSIPGRSAGFSLIEVMVGMVIALLATIVMMNVFSMFESQKRTTSGGSDLQNSGAIAMFSLQNEIEKAGFGLNDRDIMGCKLTLASTPSISIPTIAPVIINPTNSAGSALIPGADNYTDTLLVLYGNTNNMPDPDKIQGRTPPSSGTTVTTLTMNSPNTYAANEEVIVWPFGAAPPSCNLTVDTVTSLDSATNPTAINLNIGVPYSSFPTVGDSLLGFGKVFNLGASYTLEAYAIRNGNLTVCTYSATVDCSDSTKTNDPTVWLPIGADIVSMRAEYGVDTNAAPMNGVVDSYSHITPDPANPVFPNSTAPLTSCDWWRVRSVRIVLVGRNSQPNPNAVTTNAPSWSGSSAAPINLSATNVPPNFSWKNYRYKTFETTTALRNIVMKGADSNC